jgi:uncharacterized protein (TIGR03435 family)
MENTVKMKPTLKIKPALILIAAVLTAPLAALSQSAAPAPAPAPAPTLTFDAASIHSAAPPDMPKMMAELQAGRKPESVHLDGSRATFVYQSLKELIAYAYRLRVYEVSGPDWLVTDRFDIVARMPDGATKDDVPAMLQALLADRFKLMAHQELQDQPVLGLIATKDGPKLKVSATTPQPLDETIPLKPGQTRRDTPEGPTLLTSNEDGSTTYDLGVRGSFNLKFNGETRSMHMDAPALSMTGFAYMMTSLGAGQGRQVVDMTGLTGLYQSAVDFSLMDLVSSLHSQGIEVPVGGNSDPDSGPSVSSALDKLGLKLEKTHAKVNRLVIDHVEKGPTEN